MSAAARRTAGAAGSTIRASINGSRFPAPGRVTVSTGRVEIGQGVLTAMLQIAAEELDVAPDRIRAADRRHRADAERGLHRGQPVDPIRRRRVAPGLRRGARPVSRPCRGELRLCRGRICRCSDGAILRRGEPTGHDYWSLAGGVDLAAHATGQRASQAGERATASSGRTRRASISPAKVFGEPVFVHDMALDGMVHARVVRQPRRGATIATIDEAAIRRAAKGPDRDHPRRQFPRDPRRRRDRRRSRRRGCARPCRLGRGRRDQSVPGRGALAVAAALDRPDRRRRRPPIRRRRRAGYEATYTRMHIAHASVAPSCGAGALSRRASCRCGRIRRASIRCARRWPGH